MADKVKTAAEIAAERHPVQVAGDEGPEHTAAELPDLPEPPQGNGPVFQPKLESHVINQDEATGFDADKVSGRFKDDKQSFSRIKNVYAAGPTVVIEIDKDKIDLSIHAAMLTTQRVTPEEAVQRAVALNQMLMLDKINIGDRKQVGEIVEATIEATMEAQENIMRANGAGDEDIKRVRKKRLDRIEAFESAVKQKRGPEDLAKLQEFQLFKRVLTKIGK